MFALPKNGCKKNKKPCGCNNNKSDISTNCKGKNPTLQCTGNNNFNQPIVLDAEKQPMQNSAQASLA